MLQRLSDAQLKVSLNKCSFLSEKLTVFGYQIDRHGFQADPKRVEALKKIPYPSSKKEMTSVLASMNYLRPVVRNFGPLSTKLYASIYGKSDFKMTDGLKKQFDMLKEAIAEKILMSPLSSEKRFILETDASIHGCAAVLKQRESMENDHIVAVNSSGLKGAEPL